MNYKIQQIIIVRLSNSHIPYFKGLLIVGPRGGKYLLDEFNSEKLIKTVLKDKMELLKTFDFRIPNMLMSFGLHIKKLIVMNEDVLINTLAKKYNAKALIRQDGLETVKKISDQLEYSELMEFIITRDK